MDRSVVGVTVGANAVLAVNVSQPGSWVGPVSLSVTGAPVHATVGILPNPVLPGVPAVVTLFAAANTPVGSYLLTITATNGVSTTSITVTLVVSLPTGFTMSMSPPVVTVVDGSTGAFDLNVDRGLLSGPIALAVSGLPQYATAKVTPSLSLVGSKGKVTVTVPTNVVPGMYLITVKGSALLASGQAQAYLRVVPQTYPPFPITATIANKVAPGGPSAPIAITITNPNSSPMTVTDIGAVVASTDKPGCNIANYETVAYSGPASLTVPANSTRTLTQLGVADQSKWPALKMLNLPVNQDICKNAHVSVTISATGDGA